MVDEKQKDTVSVREIETYAKKHRFELFLCLSFLLACFFSFVFFGAWCLILAAIGGILGTLFAPKVDELTKKIQLFVVKQEKTTQLVLGIVGLVLSIFLPVLIFFALGVGGGRFFRFLGENLKA